MTEYRTNRSKATELPDAFAGIPNADDSERHQFDVPARPRRRTVCTMKRGHNGHCDCPGIDFPADFAMLPPVVAVPAGCVAARYRWHDEATCPRCSGAFR
jgi:hypothetical protein